MNKHERTLRQMHMEEIIKENRIGVFRKVKSWHRLVCSEWAWMHGEPPCLNTVKSKLEQMNCEGKLNRKHKWQGCYSWIMFQ